MDNTMLLSFLVLIISYILGSIPIGLIVGKVSRGIDIRQFGSGNIGATNVLRTLGIVPATVVFIGDTLKGLGAVLIARSLLSDYPMVIVLAGLAAIAGHSASVFLGFKGGKGVATSLGVIIGITPLVACTAFGLWVIIVAVTRYVSIASIIASISAPIMMWFSQKLFGRPTPIEYTIFAAAAAVLILIRHKSNISRLISGTEPRIGHHVQLK